MVSLRRDFMRGPGRMPMPREAEPLLSVEAIEGVMLA
jgi:hypothetical protein